MVAACVVTRRGGVGGLRRFAGEGGGREGLVGDVVGVGLFGTSGGGEGLVTVVGILCHLYGCLGRCGCRR